MQAGTEKPLHKQLFSSFKSPTMKQFLIIALLSVFTACSKRAEDSGCKSVVIVRQNSYTGQTTREPQQGVKCGDELRYLLENYSEITQFQVNGQNYTVIAWMEIQ